MQYIFTTSGETPSKKNSRVTNRKTGRTFPNSKYVTWHKNAVEELKQQAQAQALPEALAGPLEVKLFFTHGDLRRRDSDNGTSSILDTLKDSGILLDDNFFIVSKLSVYNTYKKGAAFCQIVILGYDPINFNDINAYL